MKQVRCFSTNTSSSLFTKRLRELRQQIKDADNPGKTEGQKSLNTETGQQQQEKQAPDLMRPELIYSLDLEEVLGAMKRVRLEKMNKQSHDFYNACLERINQLVIEKDSKVQKNDLLAIVREFSNFKPKEEAERERMKRQQGLYSRQEAQDDLLSVRHKRIIEEKNQKFRTVPGDMASFVFQNLSKGFFRDLFTQFDDEQASKTRTSLYDVLSIYIQLYQNIEVRINDMISRDMIDGKEALDVLVSYSVAEEGTNTLYVRLVEKMLQRTEEYSMIEVEMILNYFPHNIWRSQEENLRSLQEAFYYPLIVRTLATVNQLDKRAFLSVFQGLTLAGDLVFKSELLNAVLNSYVSRLQEKQFATEDVMAFLELFVQYMRTNTKISEQIEVQTLLELTVEHAFPPENTPQMTIHQISGLLWIIHNLHVTTFDLKPGFMEAIEERLSKLLRQELLLQKQLDRDVEAEVQEGLQTMSVHDLEVIEHYYKTDEVLISSSRRHKELLKLIAQAKHWDKPENDRKWFHI